MFKSIPPANSRSPSARYHLAAQAAIPMLTAWAWAPSEPADRDARRSRFQLDAAPAGRAFFEMVTFMMKQLRKDGFPESWESFASPNPETLVERPARSRYRYVSELYVAALLYYTNKFANEELGAVRERLFAWAYALRVTLLRVQIYRSIDILGRGDGDTISAFTLLRDAMSGDVVDQLPTSSKPYVDGHESTLAALLTQVGA